MVGSGIAANLKNTKGMEVFFLKKINLNKRQIMKGRSRLQFPYQVFVACLEGLLWLHGILIWYILFPILRHLPARRSLGCWARSYMNCCSWWVSLGITSQIKRVAVAAWGQERVVKRDKILSNKTRVGAVKTTASSLSSSLSCASNTCVCVFMISSFSP